MNHTESKNQDRRALGSEDEVQLSAQGDSEPLEFGALHGRPQGTDPVSFLSGWRQDRNKDLVNN